MADGVIAVNNMGEIIHINPRAMEMLGVYSEAIGHNFSEVFSEAFGVLPWKNYLPKMVTVMRFHWN